MNFRYLSRTATVDQALLRTFTIPSSFGCESSGSHRVGKQDYEEHKQDWDFPHTTDNGQSKLIKIWSPVVIHISAENQVECNKSSKSPQDNVGMSLSAAPPRLTRHRPAPGFDCQNNYIQETSFTENQFSGRFIILQYFTCGSDSTMSEFIVVFLIGLLIRSCLSSLKHSDPRYIAPVPMKMMCHETVKCVKSQSHVVRDPTKGCCRGRCAR